MAFRIESWYCRNRTALHSYLYCWLNFYKKKMMNIRNIITLILLTSGYLCGAQTTIVDSFQSNGIWRSYRLYVPATYSPSAPGALILNMHGLGSNALEQQVYSDFSPIADTAGFLMAYPQGLTANGTTYWNVGIPLTPATDDLKFLTSLIDTISARYAVDRYRVYATGMSLGGYMSHYLALKANTKIAAIASVTGTIFPGVYATANPGRAVPMMQVHGTADPTVPYNGNGTGIAIDTLVAFWVKNNGCNPLPVRTTLPDINPADNTTAVHDVYTGGTNGATCEFYKINGGGHTWPGSPINIGVTNQDFDASTEIWRFFNSFRLNQFLSVKNNFANGVQGAYPNPCSDFIFLTDNLSGAVTVSDINGRALFRANGPRVRTAELAPGVYFLRYNQTGKTIVASFEKR